MPITDGPEEAGSAVSVGSSLGISSFDLKSLLRASSNGEEPTEGSPDRLLANAYSTASKAGVEGPNLKFLNQYHKCLFALIKVMTKRMQLFYQGKYRSKEEFEEIELRFQSVMSKIMAKMKKVENQANESMGKEQTKQVLMPLASIL
jgi:hypothetical protein